MNAEGGIVTAEGYPLEPAITIPANATSVSISKEGVVSVTVAGQNAAQQLGTIELATFQNPPGLRAARRQLLRGDHGVGRGDHRRARAPKASAPSQQGFLEESNVSIVEEMVNMILGAARLRGELAGGADGRRDARSRSTTWLADRDARRPGPRSPPRPSADAARGRRPGGDGGGRARGHRPRRRGACRAAARGGRGHGRGRPDSRRRRRRRAAGHAGRRQPRRRADALHPPRRGAGAPAIARGARSGRRTPSSALRARYARATRALGAGHDRRAGRRRQRSAGNPGRVPLQPLPQADGARRRAAAPRPSPRAARSPPMPSPPRRWSAAATKWRRWSASARSWRRAAPPRSRTARSARSSALQIEKRRLRGRVRGAGEVEITP